MSGKFIMHQELFSEQMLLLHLEETHWSTSNRSRGLKSGKHLIFPFWIKNPVPSLLNHAQRALWSLKVKWKAWHLSRPAQADGTSQLLASCCSWGNPAQTRRDQTQHLAGSGKEFELCFKMWFAFESRHVSIHDSGYWRKSSVICIPFHFILIFFYGNTTNIKLYCIKEASFSQIIKCFTGQFLNPGVSKKGKPTLEARADVEVLASGYLLASESSLGILSDY